MNNLAELLTLLQSGLRYTLLIKALLISIFFCLICEGSTAATQSDKITAPTDKEVVAKVDEYMNALSGLNRFRGTILIARDGRVVLSRSYGLASLEDEVPNTRQTKFHLASITKQFTAAAIMMLQERGLLSVQDPVCKYLSPCPAAWRPVTIHHLLTMSSGIPNFTDFPDWLRTRALPATLTDAIERFRDKPLDFQPGEKYSYSNSGYVLLAYIIERVSGRTYEGFLRENIFAPLGMVNTGYDDNKVVLKRRAIGYAREGIRLVRAPYLSMGIVKGAGGLYSTVDDLYLWDQALYAGKLISKKSLDAMFTIYQGDYGYGWHIDRQFNRKRFFYAGVQIGFKPSIDRYMDDRVAIIILNNADDVFVNSASRDLAAIVFGEKYNLPKQRSAVKLDPKVYDDYVGQYQLEPDFILTLTKEGDRLVGKAEGRTFELLPETETKFFIREYDAQIMFTFVKDEKGRVTHLIYNRNQRAPKIS
jgi:CubicO group peptidase (beta-lactamase class C family)